MFLFPYLIRRNEEELEDCNTLRSQFHSQKCTLSHSDCIMLGFRTSVSRPLKRNTKVTLQADLTIRECLLCIEAKLLLNVAE